MFTFSADTFTAAFGEEGASKLRDILESVNASVTRSLLEDNLKKWAATTNAGFSPKDILEQLGHAQPLSPAQLLNQNDEEDEDSDAGNIFLWTDKTLENTLTLTLLEGGKRVRALFTDEQMTILKGCYSANPKPKREELKKLAEDVGQPFKVVKVWFQNTRARDRREAARQQVRIDPRIKLSAVCLHLNSFF